MKQIRHKQKECVGCDACAELAPQYFKIDDDGKARLRQLKNQAQSYDFGLVFPDDLAQVQAAADSCAVQIISVQ